MVLTPLNGGESLWYALVLKFKSTINEVEYEALITGLCLAWGICFDALRVKCDSQLVVNQVKGEYQAKEVLDGGKDVG